MGLYFDTRRTFTVNIDTDDERAWTFNHMKAWAMDKAPNDWEWHDILAFWDWVMANAEEWPYDADWPTLAREFDKTRKDD